MGVNSFRINRLLFVWFEKGVTSKNTIFRFFDPQNLSESLQIGGGWFGGIFPDIFYFFEKIAFLAILARLALQNVQVVFQNDQNGHFWPFLAIFGVQKVRDPPKSIRMRSRNPRGVSPEKLWGH